MALPPARRLPAGHLVSRPGREYNKTMKTAPALALIAAGAIVAFAVHAHPRFFSFQIAGWVIMLTGIAGLVIPRRGYRWVRRVTRRPPAAAGTDRDRRRRRRTRRSPAVAATDRDRRLRRRTRRPRGAARAAGAGRLPIGWTFRRRPNPALVTTPLPDPVPEEAADGTAPGPDLPSETVEEFFP